MSTAEDVAAITTMGGFRAFPVGPRLVRLVDRGGRVVGHLEERGAGDDRRFVARRYHAPSRSLRALGEFCTAREATECLRWSR